MKCPSDNATLVMSDRAGIEIDYCPECRGVWLDRGELDKIIDRSASAAPQATPSAPSVPSYDNRGSQGYQKKPKNWLSEIFD